MNSTHSITSSLAAVFRPNLAPNYWSQGAWTVLRVVVGLVMVHNGMDKLADIENFSAAYAEVIGLPFPIFFTYLAAFTEMIGAPLVALGLLTRPAALGLFATMCVASYHHILVSGFSIPYLELSSIYMACFLFYLINGAGIFSVDALISRWLGAKFRNQKKQQMGALESSYQTSSHEVMSKN
ncbi:MAG: DoxX family protein [Cyanobacteria bacterium QH_8_48_120]|nr:MAG: DoxX family protein [Cyanobacteria bacterium QH_6_48_35]PSO69770.1 MAG: DoxX family protein [Cyanobacteria bacterium QH_3_48_40]PSO75048.1 MAG: DoxX family protein [Cyanobacteria bacterium QH_8_48_120]PSP04908.1 MAG: DoxX family protein [Cyanobacteria bacterium QS_7_48_42]PSP15227.1 MAG: DoxX family protein [Cyanobacteria bacterium SW_11_48_12]PSP18963.1 MAG: DoxX family protein [Cyanobacteria bacterium SW_5_48_44]PSP31063.1 MAG: DoxX family protein [Cyanobacteria bacterium SW_4_48_29